MSKGETETMASVPFYKKEASEKEKRPEEKSFHVVRSKLSSCACARERMRQWSKRSKHGTDSDGAKQERQQGQASGGNRKKIEKNQIFFRMNLEKNSTKTPQSLIFQRLQQIKEIFKKVLTYWGKYVIV